MGLHGHLPGNETCCAAHHQGFLLHFLPFFPHAVCLAPTPTWAQYTHSNKNQGYNTDEQLLFFFYCLITV